MHALVGIRIRCKISLVALIDESVLIMDGHTLTFSSFKEASFFGPYFNASQELNSLASVPFNIMDGLVKELTGTCIGLGEEACLYALSE